MYGVFDCSFYRVAEDLEVIAPLLKKHGDRGVSIPAHCLNSRGDALRARRLSKKTVCAGGLCRHRSICMPSRPTTTHFPTRAYLGALGGKWPQLAGVSRAYNHVHPGSNTRPFEQNFSWYRERIAAVPRRS